MDQLFRLDIVIPNDEVPAFTGWLFTRIQYGWEELEQPDHCTLFRVHIEDPSVCETISQEVEAYSPSIKVTREDVPKRDWALAWREFFTAVLCGEDFIVIAPWMEHEQPYKDRIPIIIDPKMAFGTGHHPTTALCLEALSELFRAGRIQKGQNFLDLGTGSGILGMGAAKLGLKGEGLDTDPIAIDNALENKEINNVDHASFAVAVGSIEAATKDKYDLVLANILAEPLIGLASQIKDRLAENGVLVLSGLLVIQADAVTEAYTALGMPTPRKLESGEWAALIWD